ncbi:lantibiotic dehydratase [Bacillus sp. APMAM]|nr:lantibiotic dehydratase [Bacillus sp. APMAM]RTZ53151.1 hypothetical protein EKO25_24955 [Bacillus sp. SAJ1]
MAEVQEKSFLLEDFFIVRSHLLPNDYFEDFFNFDLNDYESINNWIEEIKSNSLICEAIFTASPSLYNSLMKWDKNNKEKKLKQIVISLSQYLIRLTTRPTPYGLLAGVSYGTFGETSQIQLKKPKYYKKRTRPDMNWLLSVIKKMESNIEVLEKLIVTFNPLAIMNGNRLNIYYNSQGGVIKNDETQYYASIRNTPPVQFIKENSKNGIYVSELIKKIKLNFKNADEYKCENMIMQLINQDFLITQLRPPLLNNSPLDYLIDTLRGIENDQKNIIRSTIDYLTNIKHLMIDYDKLEIGKGTSSICDIDNFMRKISDVKNTIQVDMKLEDNEIRLNKEIKKEISNAVEVLINLSCFFELPHLVEYTNMFLEKYGLYREVPILELLDEGKGLGAPPTYSNPMGNNFNLNNQHYIQKSANEEFLLSKLVDALKNNKNEINISIEEINKLDIPSVNKTKLIDNIELFCSLNAKDLEDLDRGNYKIVLSSPNSLSNGIRSIGRFSDLPGFNNINLKLKNIYNVMKNYYPNSIFTQLTYLPDKASAANVMISENYVDYEISISTNPSSGQLHNKVISISDLLVGSDGERLYLKSKSLNKEVTVYLNNMINTLITPNIFRFIAEVGYSGKLMSDGFSWGSLSNSIFLPRVTVGNVIISLASWKVSNTILNTTNKTGFEEWKDNFLKYKQKWGVPRKFFILEGDNKLLLDSENIIHLNILFKQLRKNGEKRAITIEEYIDSKNIFLNEEGSSLSAEIIFPMRKNGLYMGANKKNEKLTYFKSLPTNSEIVMKRPGSEWFYIKMYINLLRENEFLCEYLPNFCERLKSKNIIKEYFFVRYKETASHIRLRFLGEESAIADRILVEIKKWTNELIKMGLLDNFEISNYEREVERYGGPEIIELVESYFHLDSINTISILNMLKEETNSEIDINIVATVSVLNFLNIIESNIDDQIKLLDLMILQEEHNFKSYRAYKTSLEQLCNNTDNWKNLRSLKWGEELFQIFKRTNIKLKEINNKLNAGNQFYNSREDILLSILHLHMNRLIGIDRSEERKILCFAKYTLNAYRFGIDKND